MSSGYLGKQTNWPDDVEGRRAIDERNSQWGEIPGEIVSFNGATQTATIKPLFKPKFNGKPVNMPELLEVPVRFERAGNGALTYPVKPGDKVALRPQMRSSENYHTEGDGAASDARSFNLSDMEAHLAGGESLKDPIPNFDGSNVHMRFDKDGNFGIKGNEEGKFKIEGKEGNLYDLIATFMELVAADALQINYGSSAGSGHALQNKAQLLEIAAKVRGMAL